jgi:hypothetical protein
MGPGSPAVKLASTVVIKKDLGGFAWRGEYTSKKTKEMPAFVGTFFLGYQPADKLYTLTSADSMGGAELATSSGFEGDRITFTGDAFYLGRKIKVRETMIKGEKKAGHTLEIDTGSGFQPAGEDACKK